MTSVFHILNPSAGQRGWVRAVTEGQTAMAPWAWVSREHPLHTETLVDWALREGTKRLVVWGGDGTFHRVVETLWRRRALEKVELALVPCGTCNDLARRLNLSKYYWRRWEASSPEGRPARLAVGRLAWENFSTVFVNNAGFGRSRESYEAKQGPWGVLKSFEPIGVAAEWDAGRLDGRYYMMLACNAPYFSGGLHFEKTVSPETGTLQVYFVPATSKARLAWRLLRGRLGQPMFDTKTTKISTRSLRLRTDRPVWPQADGEPPPAAVSSLELGLLPEQIRLWCPAL
ncbi:MAG TPA: diacylglycerol kinase family protein [Elusimicrobiota bacterium]|nr:diacylglycerol kinase family protein [Elusimicrobiota bacterium]